MKIGYAALGLGFPFHDMYIDNLKTWIDSGSFNVSVFFSFQFLYFFSIGCRFLVGAGVLMGWFGSYGFNVRD